MPGMTILGVQNSGVAPPTPAADPTRTGVFFGRAGVATFASAATAPTIGGLVAMSITPMYVGDLDPIDTWTLKDDTGAVINLTNVTANQLTLKLVNLTTGVTTTGAGAFAITNAAGGVTQYTWAAADTSTPGRYYLYVVVNFNGTRQQTYGPNFFEIRVLGS